MNRDDIIRMAREAGLRHHIAFFSDSDVAVALHRFANLVRDCERVSMMQLFTDPENQPTQYGTVTVEYMQREIAAEREAMLDLVDSYAKNNFDLRAAIRARGQA